MLTEFEVRRRMADIAESAETPFKKVRRLLKLERRLRRQTASLESVRRFSKQTHDPNADSHLTRLTDHTNLLREDLRSEALMALREVSKN